MRVLFIYRHPDMGFSIGKVFRPIEEEMRKYAEVDSVYMPVPNYKPKGLWMNIKAARTAVREKEYDIVHITGAEHYLIPFLKNQKVVVTVHDLGFFTNSRPSVRTLWKYSLWIKTLAEADCVTFISEKSMEEAKRFVRFGKAAVVYNPVGKEFRFVRKRINTECPTILHIGTKPNKNLETTAIALKDFPCRLRIVGDLTEGQKAVLGLYRIRYEAVSNLTDDEILREYAGCDFVNFPSLYEGFGMPIIEGQASGRPVLTSDLSPMREIAGKGAVIINPTKPEQIREGYRRMVNEAERLVTDGLENVKRFSLEDITKQYLIICNITLSRK